MRLDEFQWSRNPRGLHNKRVLITPVEFDRWTDAGFGWAKLVAAQTEYVDDCIAFLQRGVTPIVRLYRDRWGARPFDRTMRDETLAYLSVGVRWFEFYNEPNLPIEWPPGTNIDWRNGALIAPLMDNWLIWAEFIISQGGYPGFIALAESATSTESSVLWMDAFLNYLHQNHRERFRAVLANGAYCATHPYILNHYYQQIPGRGPLSARPPEQQNAREGGWHFEYPYDPICQATDPGRTVYGGTPLTPYGDPVGLLAMGRMFNERCAALFGTANVPVVGTEGGIWPFPRDGQTLFYQQDNRYPPYTHESQAEGTVAMFEWIARYAPPWFFGVCLWKEDEYYEPGPARAITRLAETPPLYVSVPPLEVMAGPVVPTPTPTPEVYGPGPIHGTPDVHMVVLAGGLTSEWFLETARLYYGQFRPVVTTQTDLIQYIPNSTSLAVTLIAPPDQADAVRDSLRALYPNVWVDVIRAEALERVRAVLDARAQRGLRFG